MKTLSILIPVYNEEESVNIILDIVSNVKLSLEKEIVIINDGSTDNSDKKIKSFLKKNRNRKKIKYVYVSKENGGKGSAIREGIKAASGDIIIVQDADLEYNPNEYQSLIDPIINNKAKVVYGSRVLNNPNVKKSGLSFYLGGRLLSFLTNFLYGSRITDEPTCYKVFHKDVIKNIPFISNKFNWEPEITAKILRKNIKIYEIPISYNPRSKKEGKKISWKDGLQAITTLFYWRFKKTRSFL